MKSAVLSFGILCFGDGAMVAMVASKGCTSRPGFASKQRKSNKSPFVTFESCRAKKSFDVT